ncbi:MAG: choice-of-anchor J domain-containing protein [Candidatus Neomarinimicrobiota bacterium]
MKIFLLFNFFNIVFISAQIQNTFNTIIESGEVVQKKSHKNIVSLSKLNKADKIAENSSSLIIVSPQIRTSYRPSTTQNITSRNAQWCGTMPQWELNNPDQRSCNLFGTTDDPNIRDSFIPELNDDIIYIRLIVHGFADDNGNNPTTTIEDVEAQIFTLNEAFIDHKIQFVAWFQTHNSSESQILSSADWASGNIKEVFSVDPLSYHNIYVVDTDSDFGILGVSTFPWDSDALTIYGGTLIDKDWFGGPRYFNNLNNVPQKTIVHELGHALGLWHTQHGVGEVEECGPCYEGADGYQYSGNDNEDIVGDLCSDTKGTVINYACSDPEGNDCQGNSWNNTDFHNYMGYADDDCYNLNNQGFTAQQSGRLHGWIMDKYEGLIVNKTENLLISTSFEENGLPSGWFAYDGNVDGNTWSIGSDLLNPGFDIAYFGNNGAMLFTAGSNSNNDYLISPLIDIPSDANNCNLSFWGTSHNPSYLDDFVIRISTDGSIFDPLGVVYNTPSNWTNYSIDLNDYLGQSVYLAIEGISSSGHYLFIDDFVVSIDNEDLPLISDFSSDFTSGPLPLDVSFTDLSSGSPHSWQWFFGDGSSSQEQNPIHTYTTPGSYTVTLEITKDDETDSEIKTNHIAVGNILSQDFSSGIPSDWSILNVNNDNINWQVFSESSSSGADIAHSGDLSVGIHYNTNGNNDWLITNSLVLPDNNNITFSLWARSFDPNALEDFNVLVSSSSNNSLSDFNSISNTTNVPNTWTQYFYDISNYSGDTVFIAIQSVSVDAWYLFVDDFFINNEPIVNDIPAEFSLVNPSDSVDVTTQLPLLDWEVAFDPDPLDTVRYKLYLDTPEPGVVIVHTDTSTSFQIQEPLQDNTTYYWKVIATDLSGATTENIGGYHSFRVNTENDLPSDFALLTPENISMVTDLTPTLRWDIPTDADDRSRSIVSYHVYLDTNLTNVIPDTVITNSYTPEADLLEDAMYSWKVIAVDNDGGIKESSPWSFTTNSENSPPAEFSLVEPLDNAVLNIFNPPFCWEETTDPDFGDTITYAISLGKHLDSMIVIYVGPFMASCFYETMGMVEDNTTYYWNVVASDDAGAVSVSNIQTFTINTQNDSPGLATLIAPLQGSMQTDIRPGFYWLEAHDPDPFDHVTYSIEWWPVNETDVMFIEDVDTNTFTPEFDLSDNAKFGWRVTAKDIEGLSSMTDSSYFFTDAFPEPPLAFNTVYPENNAEGLGTSIDFVWNKTIDPDPLDEVTYQLIYGTDWQDSSTYVYSDITTDTSTSVLLDDNIQYYWIVVARDADGFIVGSNNDTPNMVTVGTLSLDNNTVPTVFALHQNYPNPFNPTTKISYDLPKNEFVSISIYNVMGRKMKSLINAMQEAGYRSLTWNATDDLGQSVSAGMYIYTIQAGEFRQTRKMVLLK